MARRFPLILALVLVGSFPYVPEAIAEVGVLGDPIDNEEQRVTDHGFRDGAPQDKPDISQTFIVWRDNRGDSDQVSSEPFGHIWSKNLTTRDEAPVRTSLATDDANPRIAGNWVVWTDHVDGPDPDVIPDNDDIFARKLPNGPVIQVTTHPAHQMNPAIHKATVVWEDYRNQTNPSVPNVDIFRRKLPGGSEQKVVQAPGNQVSPTISGTTIAWRDARDVAPDTADADVYVKIGAASPIKIADAQGRARSLSEFQVAVSGTRLLWNEKDPACDPGQPDCALPRILKSCEFGPAGCLAPPATIDTIPTGMEFGTLTDLDLSGSRAVWVKRTEVSTHAYTLDLATTAPILQVDDSPPPGNVGGVRVDGERLAWSQSGDLLLLGSDVLWRTTTTQPLRANSTSLGSFGGHSVPAADGNVVVYRRTPVEEGPTDVEDAGGVSQVWATDLSPPRRHFPVTTLLGTEGSRPAIVGQRVVWSQCLTGFGDPRLQPDFEFPSNGCGNIFETTLTGPQPGELTDLSKLGPPDADGSSTAWRCGDVSLCFHDGEVLEFFDLSAHLLDTDPLTEAFSAVGRLVRLSGGYVVWFELFVDPGDPDPGLTDARIHVLNATTGDDVVIGEGLGTVGGFPDFDISGSTVVWAAESDTIWRAHATCAGGPGPCPEVFVTQPDHSLRSPTIDGDRAAWVAEDQLAECCATDIYTTTLGDGSPHLVTNDADSFVESPYVDGHRIYWTDGRLGTPDIFVESADPSEVLPPPDEIPPEPTEDFAASAFGGAVELSWTNPTEDFFRVRILRKSGLVPPSGLDDTSASVVYEGSGTTFTDTDVVLDFEYSYLIVAFDLEPNFSTPQTATT